jgi:two-component system chemotaxis sensor kinase CheA
MPNKKTPNDWKSGIRKSVETVAMQVVMEEDLSKPCRTLRRICKQADEAGRHDLAALASSLIQKLKESGDGVSHSELASEGLFRLQQAIEAADSEEAPPEASPSPLAEEPATSTTAASQSLAQDADLLNDFILEAREHLSSVEVNLLAVEQDPKNPAPLNTVFRGFHTIKGLAGFLELHEIQNVAHEVETILDLARNDRLEITPEVIDVVLRGADYLKAAVNHVDATLRGGAQGGFAENDGLIELIRSAAEPGVSIPLAPLEDVAAAAPPESCPEVAISQSQPASSAAPESPRVVQPKTAAMAEVRSIKVDTGKLDHLVDMVGELVIAQSLLRHNQDAELMRNQELQHALAALNGIASDIQKTAMGLRMITVGTLFQRMGRVVRDLSRKAGKQVELITSGEETELDRQIVEDLADPLLHMVRNSIDHGLETAEERVAAGKDSVGKIRLSAQHQGGQILIEVGDDGRGISREKILNKAREKGMLDSSSNLSDSEVYNLIFTAGFSTAEKVTDVSGRGVGMDVVRQNISKLRGRVEVTSTVGQGTTFLLKLPLTLAIIDGLVVGVASQKYIVPLYSVLEMLRPSREACSTVQNQGEMVLVRGSLLPIVRLDRCFRVQARAQHPADGVLIVAELEGKRFAVLVDEFIGKQEVVIKNLGGMLRHISGISGGAILGDGRVGLILDLEGICAWRQADA